MEALTPTEPLPPQLAQGVVNGVARHKTHIVLLNVAAGAAPTQDRQKQHCFRR
jgi:hypothetical protein